MGNVYLRVERGWTPADMNLSSERESYRRELLLMRDAGMNMIRIPGITFYESNEFYEMADELGIMVWQELPFANFDYPFEVLRSRHWFNRNSARFWNVPKTSRLCSQYAAAAKSRNRLR